MVLAPAIFDQHETCNIGIADEQTISLLEFSKHFEPKGQEKRKPELRVLSVAIDGLMKVFVRKLRKYRYTVAVNSENETKLEGKYEGYRNCKVLLCKKCSGIQVFTVLIWSTRVSLKCSKCIACNIYYV